MAKYLRDQKGFLSLISMLVTLAIICFCVYYMMKNYFSPQIAGMAGVSSPGLSGNVMGSAQSIVSSTREKVDEINRKSQEQMNQLEQLNK